MDVVVRGRTVDDQTRCAHYSGPTDVVAIKFKCCDQYYPCFRCHHESADHPAEQWPDDQLDQRAILCGACRTEHTIRTYLDASSCPACGVEFNPGCRLHRHLYFARPEAP